MGPGNYHVESLAAAEQAGESPATLVMLSQSAIMKRIFKVVRRVALKLVSALITGSTEAQKAAVVAWRASDEPLLIKGRGKIEQANLSSKTCQRKHNASR